MRICVTCADCVAPSATLFLTLIVSNSVPQYLRISNILKFQLITKYVLYGTITSKVCLLTRKEFNTGINILK